MTKSMPEASAATSTSTSASTSTSTSTIAPQASRPPRFAGGPGGRPNTFTRPNAPSADRRNNNREQENKEPTLPMNFQITAPEVRLIVPRGEGKEEMVGVMPTVEAQRMASDMQLDLVMISDKSTPPVCKIIDSGKYRYELEKKKKEMQKKTKQNEVKEIKLSYKIDDHDFDVRAKATQKFLMAGNRVKVMVMFKGREMAHKDLGEGVLTKLTADIGDVGVVESPPRFEGRQLIMYVAPKKTK